MKPGRSEADEARSAEERSEGRAEFPPLLTGGETKTTPPQGAKVDWCTATWKPDDDEYVDGPVFSLLRDLCGPVEGQECPPTRYYQRGVRLFVRLRDTAAQIGRFDMGGPKGRVRLDLSGSGCGVVRDFGVLRQWLGQQWQMSLTRVDLAVDCLFGQYTVEDAIEWYMTGEFSAQTGRPPRHNLVGDWLSPHYGRTLEIGRRENGKMCRVYEKGRQLGDPGSVWTRFEVEIRNEDRVLPLDILTSPDEYFVGAYRCLRRILDVAARRVETDQAEEQIALGKLSVHARSAYGQMIDVLRLRMTADEIVDLLCRPGIPRRLTKASLAEYLNADSAAAHLRENQHAEAQRYWT